MKPFVLFFFITFAIRASALEIVKTVPVVAKNDFRHTYSHSLLNLALEESADLYGPYEIRLRNLPMESDRLLLELVKGTNLSVSISAAKEKWIKNTIPVQFPLMKGLASYRLFFILNKNKHVFSKIDSLNTLKQFKFGQGRGWSTAKILIDNGFKVVYGETYEGLFSMLQAERFHFFMRGVYEIPPELEKFGAKIPDLTVADSFALYTYLPIYFFVSKRKPELATRIEYGLKRAYAKGHIDRVMMLYFKDDLKRLNLSKRKIFHITNTNINPSYYEKDKPYLLKNIQ